jgi:hypothetical protein
MWYRTGADLVVVVHLVFIGFIVGGVFLTWRWPLIIWAHIPALIYGALVEFAGLTCPLTLLENDLRQRAGEAGYRDGFIAHYLVKVIYPPGLTHGMQIGLGVLLLLVAIIGYWGFLRRRGWGGAWREPWPPGARPEHGARSGTSGRRGRSLLYARSVSRTTQGDPAPCRGARIERSACGTLTLVHSGRRGPCLTPSTPASSIAPARRRLQSGVHGPADSSRFWPTEHCTSYLPTSSCG